MRKTIFLAFFIGFSTLLDGQNIYGYRAMGTMWTFIIKDNNITAQTAYEAFQEVQRIERIFSNYDEYSELAKLNNSENWMPVSPEMLEVIEFAEELRKHSDGAFDIRIGRSVDLWKKGIKEGKVPNPSALQKVNDASLDLQVDYTLVKTNAETKLDFGGIAKGYAVDKAFEKLKSMGFDTILVDGGGDMRLGESPAGQGWKIAQFFEDMKILRLENISLASSGAFYQYLENENLQYSHIVDPANQQAITVDRGVTVKAKTCMEADALATAISAGGIYGDLLKKYEFEVNLIEDGVWKEKQF